LVLCREKLGGRIAKLESQLAQQAERAELAERQLAEGQRDAEEEVRRVRQEAVQQLAAAREAAATARQQTEQQSARYVGG